MGRSNWRKLANVHPVTFPIRSRTVRAVSSESPRGSRPGGPVSAGVVEGLNIKLKVIFRRAYGVETLKATQSAELAQYRTLGKLPEPNFTDRFF